MSGLTPDEEADRWMRQAKSDLETARTLFDAKDFDACSFQAHQAAEKALKALLYSKGGRPFGHSLVGFLAEAAREGFPEPDQDVREAANSLDGHYTSSRYPDAFENQIPAEHYTAQIAQEAVECAQRLMQYSGANIL
jgi:HEPN domain-containing protein